MRSLSGASVGRAGRLGLDEAQPTRRPLGRPRRSVAATDADVPSPGKILDFQSGAWTPRDIGEAKPLACLVHPSKTSLCATSEALAELLVARYLELQSLDTQCAAICEAGLPITRPLLAKWTSQAAHLLAPVVNAIAQAGVRAPVLSAANMSSGTAYGGRWRLWLCLSSAAPSVAGEHGAPPLMWLRVTPDRLGGHAMKELAGFRGVLQASPEAGYDRFAAAGGGTLAGCWNQVAEQARDVNRSTPHPFLTDLIAASLRFRNIGRAPDRRGKVASLIAALESGLKQARLATEPWSPVGTFLNDLALIWPSLTLFLEDDGLDPENPAIQKLRQLLIPSTLWIFGRHQDSRVAAAAIHSVIGSCLMNGVDPRRYLNWILPKMTDIRSFSFPETLLPWACPETLRVGSSHPTECSESDMISLNS